VNPRDEILTGERDRTLMRFERVMLISRSCRGPSRPVVPISGIDAFSGSDWEFVSSAEIF